MGFDITGIGAAADLANSIINKIWPDTSQQDAAKADLIRSEIQNAFLLQQGQIATNTAEAASSSMFVAGWRPGIGWVCVAATFYQYLVRPLGAWGAAAIGHPVPPMPGLDDNLWQLMFGMLGFGVLRTVDKIKGVAAN